MGHLNHKARRNRDIYEFVTVRVNEKIGGRQKYTYGAVLAMAEKKFYLSQDRIAEIVREYVPDPDQILLPFPEEPPKPTHT